MDLPPRALKLAQLAYLIHPLKPGDKAPAFKNWQRAATNDSTQVERWWRENPSRSIGVRLADDETFVDIDTQAAYDQFRERCPVDTTTSRTRVAACTSASLAQSGAGCWCGTAPTGC
jgi:Bifunctional DNA primase/polymerase, N-terminal